jgi:hypothetical protein
VLRDTVVVCVVVAVVRFQRQKWSRHVIMTPVMRNKLRLLVDVRLMVVVVVATVVVMMEKWR